MPATRRRKVERRYRALLSEEMRLEDLRRTLGLTQADLARKLKVNQPRVSKIEKRPDASLEAMRSYVEALGGKLEVVAVIDGKRVRIRKAADLPRA
ncbi:MAG: helix-turn-helix domain-containing protein [Rhodospirillales bacterium]|nr:MAG: helix-turn-helix domain-containing protein [Rhodospirillales bacterium]